MNCKNRIYFTNGKRYLYNLQAIGEFTERALRFSGFTGRKSFAVADGDKNVADGNFASADGKIAVASGNRFYRLIACTASHAASKTDNGNRIFVLLSPK